MVHRPINGAIPRIVALLWSADEDPPPAHGHGFAKVIARVTIACGQLRALGPDDAAALEEIGRPRLRAHLAVAVGPDQSIIPAQGHRTTEVGILGSVAGRELVLKSPGGAAPGIHICRSRVVTHDIIPVGPDDGCVSVHCSGPSEIVVVVGVAEDSRIHVELGLGDDQGIHPQGVAGLAVVDEDADGVIPDAQLRRQYLFVGVHHPQILV